MSALTVVANTAVSLFYLLNPRWISVLIFAAIVVVEALVAMRTVGLPKSRAFLMSLAANIASALIGVPVSLFVRVPDAAWPLLAAIFLVIAFFISVWVERAVALMFIRGENRKSIGRWSWRANLYTYEGLMVLLLIAVLRDRLR
jgi:hypothetical protein